MHTGLSIDDILQRKRAGSALSARQIQVFVQGVVDGSISRPQAAAWLAFVFAHGMDDDETVALTEAMTNSGDRLSWPGLDGPFVDKHSTGGVGDKVSLILAPLWAGLGARVPMISGRGLGHTGGTLDKLESIAGYRTDLDAAALRSILADVGCFISGQTGEVAPADRLLYALRNETSTVESIPLITASILSKKLAEGIDRLVLDVKFGHGAFMQARADAEALAQSLVRVGNGAGVQTHAVLSDMNEPLGQAVGNALEVQESIRCLQGDGPADLADLVCALIDDPAARKLLDSGEAYERFARMVRAQGGSLDAPLLGAGCRELVLPAPRDGQVGQVHARKIGVAAFRLGAGRLRAEDPVHPGVGLWVHKKSGAHITKGEPWLTLVHADAGLEAALSLARSALSYTDGPAWPERPGG